MKALYDPHLDAADWPFEHAPPMFWMYYAVVAAINALVGPEIAEPPEEP